MATRRVYLVRHGEYDWNDAPSPWKGLTRRGTQQARLTARRLRDVPATAVYSSDLTRAVDTAAQICHALGGLTCVRRRTLRECALPGMKYPKAAIEASLRRVEVAFETFFRPTRGADKHDIIVSHGNTIRYFVSRALTGAADHWLRMETLNCGVTEILIAPDGAMKLVSYNDVGHLPPRLVTIGRPGVKE